MQHRACSCTEDKKKEKFIIFLLLGYFVSDNSIQGLLTVRSVRSIYPGNGITDAVIDFLPGNNH